MGQRPTTECTAMRSLGVLFACLVSRDGFSTRSCGRCSRVHLLPHVYVIILSNVLTSVERIRELRKCQHLCCQPYGTSFENFLWHSLLMMPSGNAVLFFSEVSVVYHPIAVVSHPLRRVGRCCPFVSSRMFTNLTMDSVCAAFVAQL